MELDYSILVKKCKKMLKIIKKEYSTVVKCYSDDKIIKKSYPIKAKESSNKAEKEYADSIIQQFFYPTLEKIAVLIDKGLLTWDNAIEEINLEEIRSNSKSVDSLLYESWEKLYIYKHIRYDLIMSFIIQIYLFIEKEASIFLSEKYKNKNLSTLFSCIKLIEKEGKNIDENIKNKLDMYRNIINVYKHGNGTSLDELKKNHINILNNCFESNDLSFLFNLEFVSVEELYEIMNSFLDKL